MTAKRPLSLAALIAAAILCLTAVLPASVSIADGVDSIVFTEEGDEPSEQNDDPVQDENPEPPGESSGNAVQFIEPDTSAEDSPSDNEDSHPAQDGNDLTDAHNGGTPLDFVDNPDESEDFSNNPDDSNSSSGDAGNAVLTNRSIPDDDDGENQNQDSDPSENTGDRSSEQDDSVESAISLKKVSSPGSVGNEGLRNGDEVEADIRFATARELDKLTFAVKPVNIRLTSLKMPAFDHPESAVYSVYKVFSVSWTDGSGAAQSENAEMPLTDSQPASSALTVSGLDRDYSDFADARPGATAVFSGEFRIVFSQVDQISGTMNACGVIDSPNYENASVSVSCSYSKGTASDSEGIGSTEFKYDQEDNDPENNDTESNPSQNPSDNPGSGNEGSEPGNSGGNTDQDPSDSQGDGNETPDSGNPGENSSENPSENPDNENGNPGQSGDPQGDNPAGDPSGDPESGNEGNNPSSGSQNPSEEPGSDNPDQSDDTTPQIVTFAGLEFTPNEAEGIPGNYVDWSLGNYVLEDSPAGTAAQTVRFTVSPVTEDTQVRILFSGTVSSYKIVSVTAEGVLTTLEHTSEDPTVVDFDSTLLADPDLVNPGRLPEGTECLWITAEEPSPEFTVQEFSLRFPLPESFEELLFTTKTAVYNTERKLIASVANSGRILPGDPKVNLEFSGLPAEVEVGEDASYFLEYSNETSTAFSNSSINIFLPDNFSPRILTPGVWENYDGQVQVITESSDGTETLIATVDAGVSNVITLSGAALNRITLVPLNPLTGDEKLSEVTLIGSFTSGGNSFAYAEFNATVTDTLRCKETTSPVRIAVKTPPQTPTPVPEITPTPTPEADPTTEAPAPETITPPPAVTPTPTPGSHTPVNPASKPTAEPVPTEEPLSLDTPVIYANSNSIRYGDREIYRIRNLSARGLKSSYYYVLHLMIPTGVQVSSLDIPNFGSSVRVSLVYENGSADLGSYISGESVTLTERQGTNLRYIAFQIHGATEVIPNQDVSMILKNISSRDRVATLQAILSVRDMKTSVLEQHYDKYNISLAGPQTAEPSPVPPEVSSAQNRNTYGKTSSRPLPLLMSRSKNAAKILPVNTGHSVYPMLLKQTAAAKIRNIVPVKAKEGSVFSHLLTLRIHRVFLARVSSGTSDILKLLRYLCESTGARG